MSNIKTKGIIIKRSNLGDADKILTVYTRDYGKLQAIAKGVRKISSKLAGSLEPYSLVDFIFQDGKSLDTVTSAVIIEDASIISNSCSDVAKAHYFGELIDRLTEVGEKNSELFEVLRLALFRLCQCDDNPFLLPFYELKTLDRLGYNPSVYHCVKCRHKLLARENYFSYADGGVVCADCQHLGLPKVSVEAIKVFRLIIESNISLIDRLKISPEVADEIERIIDNYVTYILERETKSKKVLRSL